MSDIRLIFLFLRIGLLLVFFISGYFLSKSETNKQYWRIAIVPILTFAIVSGLRFGRAIDYNYYYFIYSDATILRDYEFLFRLIVGSFNDLGIPYYGFIMFCSVFLVISFLYVLNKFKNAAFYILPLFLIIQGIENQIRWYLAFSFVLIAVGMLIDKRYFIAACLAIASYFVHEGMIVIVLIVVMFYLFVNKRRLFTPKISVMLFALTLMLSSVEYLQFLVSMLDYFRIPFLSEKGLRYIDNIDSVAGGKMSTGVLTKSWINNIRLFIGYAFPLYFGGTYFEKNKHEFQIANWLYNLSVFSVIIIPLLTLVEIFDRMGAVLIGLSMFCIGITIFVAYKQRFKNKIVFYGLLISFLCLMSPFVKALLNTTEIYRMMFIWDANGLDYLNPNLFLEEMWNKNK